VSESATDAERTEGFWWWRRQMHAAEQALHAAEHARPVSAEAVACICDCNLLALGICVLLARHICAYRLRAARLAVTIPCSPQEEERQYLSLLYRELLYRERELYPELL
jgi:DNA-binding transcriptional LysR family regulator